MASQSAKSQDSHFSAELDRHLETYLSTNDVVPFKTGLYTSMMLAFLIIAGCSIFAVYCLLEAFLKPIMWAVLVGTVLFPIKLAFAKRFELWVDDLEKTNTPFILGLVALPWHLADCGLTAIVHRIATQSSLVLIAIYLLLWPSIAGAFLVTAFVVSCGHHHILLLLMAFYFTILCASIKILGDKANKIAIRALSIPIWFSVLCYVGNLFGPYRLPVTLSLAALVAAISLDLFNPGSLINSFLYHQPSKRQAVLQASHRRKLKKSLKLKSTTPNTLWALPFWSSCSRFLALCVLAMKAGRPISKYRLVAGRYFFENDYFAEPTAKVTAAVNGPLKILYEIWFPHQMRAFLSTWLCGSPALYSRLRSSAGILSTLVVMALMFFGLLTLSIFLLVQVSDEMATLTMLTSDLVKRTWTNSSAMPDLLEKAFPLSDRDAMISSAYESARAWISGKLRDVVGADNPQRAEAVEAQALQLMDELYRAFKSGHAKLASVGEDSAFTMWDVTSLANFDHLKKNVVLFVQTNFALFTTSSARYVQILETTWTVVQTNLSAIFALATPLLWEVFTFGFGIVNKLLQIVMFASLLYCLLVSSEQTWKPADVFSAFLPFSSANNADSNFLFKALQRSVSGVFVITMNMSLFYGLYTWLACSLFGLNMTVVPSSMYLQRKLPLCSIGHFSLLVIAAAVAAVPVAPPWFACLPGALELWLINGENMLAILLLVCSILPSLFVNATFYTKLDDSHPYLTGLSICGGVYWLGLEGAIIGPILLCCLLFIATLYRSFGKSINIGQ
ncbi:transmembrane protein [Trichuris trichiura]|uniref:Transmembrane protein n=1 Tax=Trichuris trichiura TaxID=36087 RepID=A0A077ZE97_TRITR|nr:transmembrane protein [Trichuris trichiura]